MFFHHFLLKMTITETIESAARALDTGKQKIGNGLDKILAFGAVNGGAILATTDLIDKSEYSDPTNALIMLGTGAALGVTDYMVLNKEKLTKVKNFVGKINSKVEEIRPLSWLKTGALVSGLAFSGSQLKPYANQVISDFTQEQMIEQSDETASEATSRPATPHGQEGSLYERLGYEPLVEHDFSGTRLAEKNSTIGRIQRTLRWQPIYHAVEEAYGIPENTLAGMIMQESYGDPVQPNASNDGGLGVVHVQGTTAEQWGMTILGNSTSASDFTHGKEIKEMLEECDYDPVCAQEYDDRAHLIKVLDVAGRIVSEGERIHGSWDYGVEYYRAPGKVGKGLTWRYLRDVTNWKNSIENPETLTKAKEDFERRNSYSFDTYLENFHEMSNNWGLNIYKAEKGVDIE